MKQAQFDKCFVVFVGEKIGEGGSPEARHSLSSMLVVSFEDPGGGGGGGCFNVQGVGI